MAYSPTAQRFAYVGLGYPDGTFDEQDRYAAARISQPQPLTGGAVAPSLGAFTSSFVGTFVPAPESPWSVSDRFAILNVVYPDGSVDRTDRRTLASGLGTTDPATGDVNGLVTASLSDFVTSFTGAVEAPGVFDGGISPTLGAFTASLQGSQYIRLFFDVGYQISPVWIASVAPEVDGAIARTLGGFTLSAQGNVLPPDSTTGRLGATLSDFTSGLSGTVEPAPTYSGFVSLSIENFSASLEGSTVGVGGSIGLVTASLSDFVTSFEGTYDAGTFSGALGATLSDFAPAIRGQVIAASAINGRVTSQLSAFTTALRGKTDFTNGRFAPVLDDFGISLRGVSLDPGTFAGSLEATLGAFTFSARGTLGTATGPVEVTSITFEPTVGISANIDLDPTVSATIVFD